MTPRCTVLVPVRDGARFLPYTLRSARRLSGVEHELLFVDDGSQDETPRLLAEAARKDTRIRVLQRPPGGLVAALNAGLAAARGEWIARLDADDVVRPERLLLQLEAARTHSLDVVGSSIRCFPLPGLTDGLRRYEQWHNGLRTHESMARDRFVESPLVHPSVLFRRSTVLDAGGYEDHGWPEDYDLWLRLFERGARFGKVDRVLTFWRDHARRLTRTAAHCHEDAVRACRAEHLWRGPLENGRRPVWLAGAGRDAKRLALALRARGAVLRGFFDLDPRRLGQTVHGVPVVRLEDAPLDRGADLVLAAVGRPGGREAVRQVLTGVGLKETVDFWCVA